MSKKTLAVAASRNNTVVLQIKLNQPNLHNNITTNCKLNSAIEKIYNFLSNKKLDARKLNQTIRQHWAIENANHAIRDNALLEDKNRIRVKAQNMMIIRSFGYNIIQTNTNDKPFSTQVEANKLNFDKVFLFKGVNSM